MKLKIIKLEIRDLELIDISKSSNGVKEAKQYEVYSTQ